MDSSHWSATRSARRVVALRDEVLERLPENPVIRSVLAAEFHYLHDQLRDRYMHEGYGQAPASAQAADQLGFEMVPDMMDDAFEMMGYLRQQELTSMIRNAELYVLSPPVYATLCAAASTLDRTHLRYWHEDDLIADAGLVLFPRIQNFFVSDDTDIPEEIIALSWEKDSTPYTLTRNDGTTRSLTRLRSTAWIDTHGPIQTEDFTILLQVADQENTPYPGMVSIGHTKVLMGIGDDDLVSDVSREEGWDINLPASSETLAPGSYQEGDAIRGVPVPDWTLLMLMSMMRMSQQKKPSLRTAPFKEGISAALASKPREHHDVQVVSLSSYETTRGERDGDPSSDKTWSYSVRFPVKVHPVKQWYPKDGKHRVIMRGPFMKGPEDAPLLDRSKQQKVYKL